MGLTSGIAKRKFQYWSPITIPFWGVHVAAIVGLFLVPWNWAGFGLCMAMYAVRMFGITGGYHRYFSHRTYKMGRVMQFLMALLGTTAAQKGVLWWASNHRRHHKHSDDPMDMHSVRQDGFFHSHVGWIIARDYEETDFARIKDFAKYPELRWLNRYHLVPPVVLGVAMYATLGGWGLVWGFLLSTTLLWHGTFTINSLSHLFGRRRYQTTDDSRNNWFLAIITLGEGWHNNHHYYQRSTSQGFYWWEYDVTMYVLRVLSWVGLVKDLAVVPAHVRDRRGEVEPEMEQDVDPVSPSPTVVGASPSAAAGVAASAASLSAALSQASPVLPPPAN
jgi:stearoyl-CoA desaturase (delta-9 desaturase)